MFMDFIGNANLPKILIICPIGFEKSIFDNLVDNLKQTYSFCIINLEYEDGKISYKGAFNNAIKIENLLSEKNITGFKILFSLSLSGMTAIKLYANNKIKFDYCILDSTPMLDLGLIKEKFITSVFLKERANSNSYANEYKDILKTALGDNVDIFLNMVDKFDEISLKYIIQDTIRFNFPKIQEIRQKKLYIRYGENDFSKKSINYIKLHYNKSNIYIKKGMTHLQEFLEHNDKYIDFIKKVINITD